MKKHRRFLIFYTFWVWGIVLILQDGLAGDVPSAVINTNKACVKQCQKPQIPETRIYQSTKKCKSAAKPVSFLEG
jgi:hypothetical protein